MKEVYRHSDITRVGYYKSVLDEAGILNLIRNESLYNLTAAVQAVTPTLCVAADADYDRAISLLSELEYTPPAEGGEWECGQCHEEVPSSFDSCWNCETGRPS